MNQNISVGILCGGKSTRMGQDKALLQLNGERFLTRICKELDSFSQVLVSVAKSGDYSDILDSKCQVVCDEHREIGPIEGIYQVLSHADSEYVFVCAGDMPFIKKELVEYMSEFISSDYDCYVLADEDHVHPLCAIYSKAMLPVIEKLISEGQYRLVNILNSVRTKYIKLESTCFDKKIVKNINTKDEYIQISTPFVFCVSGVKDSGKTGLIIKLINEFIREKYSVAVIKHDGHEYDMDYPGTDTYRFSEAGAITSVIFSDTKYSINGKHDLKPQEITDRLIENIEADVIILEGQKHSHYPKIEVVREAISQRSVCDPDTLICIATDVISQKDVKCPAYGMDDISGIFLCLKRFFGLED